MIWLMENLRNIASNKGLRDKAFNIAKNPEHNGNQRGTASVVHTFCEKRFSGGAVTYTR